MEDLEAQEAEEVYEQLLVDVRNHAPELVAKLVWERSHYDTAAEMFRNRD